MTTDRIGKRIVNCTYHQESINWKAIASGLAPTILQMIHESEKDHQEAMASNSQELDRPLSEV